jgi:hypothetical protein
MSPEGRAELAALARSAAAALRLGMAARGGETLARLVDGLARLLERAPERMRALGGLLGEIVAAQERGDPIGLADRLEFELVAALLAEPLKTARPRCCSSPKDSPELR